MINGGLIVAYHKQLNIRLKEIIHDHSTFYFQNGKQRYKFIVMGNKLTYFVEHEKKTKGATRKVKSSVSWRS